MIKCSSKHKGGGSHFNFTFKISLDFRFEPKSRPQNNNYEIKKRQEEGWKGKWE